MGVVIGSAVTRKISFILPENNWLEMYPISPFWFQILRQTEILARRLWRGRRATAASDNEVRSTHSDSVRAGCGDRRESSNQVFLVGPNLPPGQNVSLNGMRIVVWCGGYTCRTAGAMRRHR